MGKKVKEDKKLLPDDVFESLLIESHQAATVVLMLNSHEEDVLAKACEAIYKFVIKCDENKILLHELGALDGLSKLLAHDDRIVRRNACMCIGVMSTHVDIRRALRKRDETIPIMVGLLAPEEDTVVHEFACLCLTSLAHDFTSKVTIYKNDAMEPLIQLLTCADPDVQKNALEAISLLLQDYQAKASINVLGGLPAIMDLMKSEYAVIQHLALVTMQRATEDADNRAALRELDFMTRLIDFISNAEWNDLHVYAVMVISNCLEDIDTLEAIKENGGLQRLVALVTDAQPPEEDEKKGSGAQKEKKTTQSRTGKKGKDDESQRGTPKPNEKAKKMDREPTPQSMPEVKQFATKAIARAARNAENRKLLHEQEVERMLILLLANDDPNVQIAAAQALGVMAENLVARESIGLWEGIEPLIKMLKNDTGEVREAAAMAVANLTLSNLNNCNEVMTKKGIEPLIEMLNDCFELASANAACALTNMSMDEALRTEIQRLGVVPAVIGPLRSNNPEVSSKAARAVASFVADEASRTLLRENKGIDPLVRLLNSHNDDVRRSASWAISVCAVDTATAEEICRCGGLEILQNMLQSSRKKNAFSELATTKLLDHNLSAKYASMGKLSAKNLIMDGFYDVGQVEQSTQILTLKEYCLGDINQRRAILLVNAVPEKMQTPAPQASDLELLEKSSKSSVTGRSSRQGGRGKGRRLETEEKKEENLTEDLSDKDLHVVEFITPPDICLIKDILAVKAKIQPLPTTRDQITALAQFVSNKMGGPIDRGQVTNFSWELAISQLKLENKSNVIPIGMIKAGIHYHRALLFKVLSDRIAVNCSLERGQYNRAWNVILLSDDEPTADGKFYPPKPYIVDLVHQPGMLLQCESSQAINYQKLS